MSLRAKFEQFEIDYANAKLKAQEMRKRADQAPTPERRAAATAAHEAQLDLCRQFRNWCVQKRDGLARELADPSPKFSSGTERAW